MWCDVCHIVVWCGVVWCDVVRCDVVRWSAVLCGVMSDVVQCGVM